MTRPLRIEYPGAWYHVMNRGAGRKKLFYEDKHRDEFLGLLQQVTDRFGAEFHAYCLMGNHYHLLVHTPEGNLQRIMRHINGVYTQQFNRWMGSDGPLFRGRYKAILVDVDNYLVNVSRYIHRNPLQARLVKSLAGYTWSSYPAYLGKTRVPEWLETEMILGQKGSNQRRTELYQAFVENDTEDELMKFYGKKKLSPILGDVTFQKLILMRYGKVDKEVAERKQVGDAPSSKKIIQQVADYYGIKSRDVVTARLGRGQRHYPRLIAMSLCQRVGRMTLNEIAALFSIGHYASVSNAIARLGKTIVKDKQLAKQISHLTQDLTP